MFTYSLALRLGKSTKFLMDQIILPPPFFGSRDMFIILIIMV